MFKTYVRKAHDDIEVEAVQLTAQNAPQVEDWCGGFAVIEHDALEHSRTIVGLNVPTQNGNRRASEGDFIVKDIFDAFFVHSQESFHWLYKESNV